MDTVISVENLSKTYRLGQIGTGTFAHDLAVWWAKVRGKPNPMLKIGEADHGNRDGEELIALSDVSFTVPKGEVLGIIGKNGAGKSTLLKILSCVTAPTSGRIRVKGRVASLLEVGTGFHPELTGRENIYLNGAILGMTKAEVARKFDEIVDFAGVEKFIDTPVKRYSSGMYVRLAFAVAAHLEPEILVVDEVLAVGDAEFQKKCLGKMGQVARDGRTVLFVSHNMASVRQLCSSGLFLENGYINYLGNLDTCIARYTNTARLTNGRIIDNGKVLVDGLNITSVEINSSEESEIYLSPDVQKLKILICGFVEGRVKISLEAKFLDVNGAVLAFYCPAHFDQQYHQNNYIISGRFELSAEIQIPALTRGDYFLDLFLTDPAVLGLWDCEKALHIRSESLPMVTNYPVLEYRKGHGAILLSGNYKFVS